MSGVGMDERRVPAAPGTGEEHGPASNKDRLKRSMAGLPFESQEAALTAPGTTPADAVTPVAAPAETGTSNQPAGGGGPRAETPAAPVDPAVFEKLAENTRGGFTARLLKLVGRSERPEQFLSAGNYNRLITRAEAAAIIAKVKNFGEALRGQPAVFLDVPLSHWAASVIYRCQEEGIVAGVGENKFMPDEPLKPVQAKILMERAVNPDAAAGFDREAALEQTRDRRGGSPVGAEDGGAGGPQITDPLIDEVYQKHKQLLPGMELKSEAYLNDIAAFRKNWEANQGRYEKVADATGVPAKLIAALHWRESTGNFKTYLHQGDPLGKPPVHWPTNIPTFYDWEEAAIHALNLKKGIQKQVGLQADSEDQAAMATYAEFYNGLGYHYKDRASPYVYAGTDEYSKGKYVADGKYDANVTDRQTGVIALMESVDQAPRGTPLEGQVLQEGKPVGGVQIKVTDPAGKVRTGTTNRAGFFEVKGGVPEGKYRVEVGSQSQQLEVKPGQPGWLQFGFSAEDQLPVVAPTTGGVAPDADPSKQQGPATTRLWKGEVLRRGSTGAKVRELQKLLRGHGHKVDVDGAFGEDTEAAVRAFQTKQQLEVDGKAGPETFNALQQKAAGSGGKKEPAPGGAGATAPVTGQPSAGNQSQPAAPTTPQPSPPQVTGNQPTLRRGATGPQVEQLQQLLRKQGYSVDVDGDFGPATQTAVRAFQSKSRLAADGVAGPMTWAALQGGGVAPGPGHQPGQGGTNQPQGNLKSGADWVKRANDNGWINSTSFADLDQTWGPKAEAFVQGLRDSGASVSITAGLRHPKRAMLMHYAWTVGKGLDNVTTANAQCQAAGINIDWAHGDGATSRRAARDLIAAFGLVAQPSLTSNHIKGLALDMEISKVPAQVTINGKSYRTEAKNRGVYDEDKVDSIGAQLGVIWYGPGDWVHWSATGR